MFIYTVFINTIAMDNIIFLWEHSNKSNKIGTACLSNWYLSTFIDPESNNTYQNNEQYMMANKAILFNELFFNY